MTNKIIAQNKDHLKTLIREAIAENGLACDLNFIDVSQITDMCSLFQESEFVRNISEWNVSKVTDMQYMFSGSSFNGNLNSWNVSEHIYITDMFEDCPLKDNPPEWYKKYFM